MENEEQFNRFTFVCNSLIGEDFITFLNECKDEKILNEALSDICNHGFLNLAGLFINMMTINEVKIDYNNALYSAGFGGNEKLINLLLQKGASNYNGLFIGLCFTGNIDFAKTIVDKVTDFKQAFNILCQHLGNPRGLEYLITTAQEKKHELNLNDGLLDTLIATQKKENDPMFPFSHNYHNYKHLLGILLKMGATKTYLISLKLLKEIKQNYMSV